MMADDRLTGWRKGQVEDFYDLIDEELVREDELNADYIDGLGEQTTTVADLAQDTKSWRFGHVIVDEAQELSPMQWRMVKRRSLNGAVTIVGDLAQRSLGAERSWQELLLDNFDDYSYRELTVNYRSPLEVNEVAERVLKRINPDFQQAKSIRSSGEPVAFTQTSEPASLVRLLDVVNGESLQGERIAVVGPETTLDTLRHLETLHLFTPEQVKGLEYDVVVVANVDLWHLDEQLTDLYVAVTRATRALTVTFSEKLPSFLSPNS